MRRTQVLQEIRTMRFEEAYGGWQEGRLSQDEAARLLGVCDRTFRRYLSRYEEEGLQGLADRRLEQVSHRRAPVNEMFFVDQEGTASSLAGVQQVIETHGLFSSLYTDRGSHYWHTPEAGGKVDKSKPTQFGRAMRQLGIEMIAAYSPEARGRSERMFRTHQDRLPKELEATGIKGMAAANRYLTQVYMPAFNAEFMQPAMEEGSAFIPYVGRDLSDILCEQHERVVGNDNCVAFEGIKLQIPRDRARLHYVKGKVRVHCYPDGHLAIFHGPRCLARFDAKGAFIQPKILAVA